MTGWSGPTCSVCAADYYGQSCTFCNASTTCGFNGIALGSCSATGSCQCVGANTGSACNGCSSGYFANYAVGYVCTACPGGSSNVCNGVGTCASGWNGAGTCTCTAPYTGAACDDPVIVSVNPTSVELAAAAAEPLSR